MVNGDALANVVDALKTDGFGVLTEIDVRETLQQKLGVLFGLAASGDVSWPVPQIVRAFQGSRRLCGRSWSLRVARPHLAPGWDRPGSCSWVRHMPPLRGADMALQMWFVQTLADVGAENSATIVCPLPFDLLALLLRSGAATARPDARLKALP